MIADFPRPDNSTRQSGRPTTGRRAAVITGRFEFGTGDKKIVVEGVKLRKDA